MAFQKGHISWNKGKKRPPFSEEWRRKISLGLKGKRKGIKRPPFSDEWKKKMGDAHRGKKYAPWSKESRKRLSLALRGKPAWNKGKRGLQISWAKGKKFSDKHRRNISLSKKGKRVGIKVHSLEWKHKLSERWKGKNNPSWKGGISLEHIRLRHTQEYKLWRKSVFERDNYTCIWCGHRGGELQADHIKPFALYPELRFAIDNGRTLCLDCHKKTPNFATKSIFMKGENYG